MLVATEGLRGSGDFGQWLRSFTISIDTSPEQSKRGIKIKSLHSFSNGYELYQYLQNTGIRPMVIQ